MYNNLNDLDLVSLRNLFFEETKAFLAAIDTETSEELHKRRERIRKIDKIIIERKAAGKFKANSYTSDSLQSSEKNS